MHSTTTYIVLGATIGLWGLLCVLLYRRFRRADWLAGSSVASCLFFLGATAATSFMVVGALYLVPIEGAVFVLALTHLYTASRAKEQDPLRQPPLGGDAATAATTGADVSDVLF